MQKNCVYCGTPFEAQRDTAKYCRPAHRVAMSQNGAPKVTALPAAKQESAPAVEVDMPPLVQAVTAELEFANRLSSSVGQQAVLLAERIAGATFDTGSSVASMHGRLTELMSKALDGVKVADDPLDEVAKRRDAKRLSG